MHYRGAVRGDVDIEVKAGPITLAVETAQPFFIDAEARIGVVSSDLPPRRAGDAPATGGPRVRLRTHTGAIHIKAAARLKRRQLTIGQSGHASALANYV